MYKDAVGLVVLVLVNVVLDFAEKTVGITNSPQTVKRLRDADDLE